MEIFYNFAYGIGLVVLVIGVLCAGLYLWPDSTPRIWHVIAVLYRRECEFATEKIAFTVLASSRYAATEMARQVILRRYPSPPSHWLETPLFDVLSIIPGNPV